jgi:hypothetical protein
LGVDFFDLEHLKAFNKNWKQIKKWGNDMRCRLVIVVIVVIVFVAVRCACLVLTTSCMQHCDMSGSTRMLMSSATSHGSWVLGSL